MLDFLRRGEVLAEGRTNEEEARLIEAGRPNLQGPMTNDQRMTKGSGQASEGPQNTLKTQI